MINSKYYLLLSCFSLLSLHLLGQEESIELNSPEHMIQEHVAQKEIRLLPGYHYDPLSLPPYYNPNPLYRNMHAHIDGALVVNENYTEPFDESSFDRDIDTSLPVGTLSGTHSVSLSGSANYSIPFEVPSGTNGMSPTLSMNYDSNSGNGIMGIGWGISGLSSISRVNKNYFSDGEVGAIELSFNDRYAIDGNRLVNEQGNYGTDGCIYHTESYDYSRITSYGNAGNSGPEWFLVETKSGLKIEFGKTHNSRLLDENNQHAIAWSISRIIDNFGNYMDFVYLNDDRDFRIDEILYTGNTNTGLQPYNKIKFSYNIRSDQNTLFIAGNELNSKYLLSKIRITGLNEELFKEYQFGYSFHNYYSHLKEVEEVNTDNVSYNSTIFKYGNDTQGMTVGAFSDLTTGSLDVFTGEYNGDGYTDVLAATYEYDEDFIFKTHTKVEFYNSDMSASDGYSLSSVLHFDLDHEVVNDFEIPHFAKFKNSDFDGDGKDELIVTRKIAEESGGPSLDYIRIYDYPYNTGSYEEHDLPVPYDKVGHSSKYLNTGDFDGDGATDYMLFLSNGSAFRGFMSFPVRDEINTQFNILGNNQVNWLYVDVLSIVDFNGDGKDDVLIIQENAFRVFTLITLPNGDLDFQEIYYSANFIDKTEAIFFGDFNGDSKIDILHRDILIYDDNLGWEISYFNGVEFETYPFEFNHPVKYKQLFMDDPYNPTPALLKSNNKVTLGDFNGDGKTDISHAYHITEGSVFSHVDIDVYYSKGISFDGVQTSTFNGDLLPYSAPLLTGDYNGDGKNDLLSFSGYVNSLAYKLQFNVEDKSNLLEEIRDGLNKEVKFDYKRTNDPSIYNGNDDFYMVGNSSVFPLMDVASSMYLVKSIERTDGLGSYNQIDYGYEEGKVHRSGRGFLGFEKMKKIDYTNQVEIEKEIDSNNSFYIPLLKGEKTKSIVSNNVISETINNYNIIDLGNNKYVVQLTDKSNIDYLNGRTNTTTCSYDNPLWGNIVTKTENNNSVASTTNTNSYIIAGGWIPSQISTSNIQYSRNGTVTISDANQISYNPSTGVVIEEKAFFNSPKELTSTYNYDNYGNLTNTTVSSNNLSPRSKSRVYDWRGRFPIKMINTLGQEESIFYDEKWGQPTEIIDINGLSTKFEYNELGKLSKTILPNDKEMHTGQEWDIDESNNQLYYAFSSGNGSPDSKVYYDILGRIKRTEVDGFDGQLTKKKFTYNRKGNLSTETSPHYNSNSFLTTTLLYDEYNRLINNTNGVNTLDYSYNSSNGNTLVTINSPTTGQTYTKTIDPTGLEIAASDDGGVLQFSYDARGNKTAVNLNGLQVMSMAYDAYGRQESHFEVNSGFIQYEYDAYSQLVYQKDANGSESFLEYDELGRITIEEIPEGTISYDYVNTGNGLNLLKKIISYEGIVQEYEYDPLNRMEEQSITVNGEIFTDIYSYDENDNLDARTYPSGFMVHYKYDENGFMTDIFNEDESVNILKVNGFNALGKTTSFTYGNGITTQKVFDLYGYPISINADVGDTQSESYNFNLNTGNLESKNDSANNMYESYSYDGLDRLTQHQVVGGVPSTGQPIQNIAYGNNGNILSKTGVGDYIYDSQKVNAVVGIDNPSGDISLLQQDISFTSFHQPNLITEGDYKLQFKYAPNKERVLSILSYQNNPIQTRYYWGDFERYIENGQSYDLHRVGGATIVKEGNVFNYYYEHEDYQGSLVTITDNIGNEISKQNFDPWGRYRSPDDGSYTSGPETTLPTWLNRGYTGHEHLPQFSLINMNGRLYDPVISRMLSPDSVVPDELSTQSYNRYTYAFNNPLKFTDPDGENPGIIVAAAVIGGFMGGISADMSGGEFWSFEGFGLGAIQGAIGGVGATPNGLLGMIVSNAYSFIPGTSVTVDFGKNSSLTMGIIPTWGSGASSGVGFNVAGTLDIEGIASLSGSAGSTYYFDSPGTNKSGFEFRRSGGASLGYSNKRGHNVFRASIFDTAFASGKSGETSQRTGGFNVAIGRFNLRYENDDNSKPFGLSFLGDGADRFRTTAIALAFDFEKVGPIGIGLNLFTGSTGMDPAGHHGTEITGIFEEIKNANGDIGETYVYNKETGLDPDKYRLGAIYATYRNYRIGINSELVRHLVQDKTAHDKMTKGKDGIPQMKWFKVMDTKISPYFYYGNSNPLTQW